ncbi:MAG TPA: class I SAM-dependent methyltransferase [Mycobacterium sp.]|nr:class I SAM-dependent methyltransferase [Mycobacterium sp.]
MNSAQLETYWQRVSSLHADASDNGLELICYAGMPQWFNQFMHHYQARALQTLLAGESLAGDRVLDLGTGVGRWARWYATFPRTQVTGVDIEPARLTRARRFGGGVSYLQMGVDRLDLADASFDTVNCVTVLQHVPHDVKRAAIAEISRVLAPNGRVVLLELTDLADDAPHVFPWPAARWEAEFAKHALVPARRLGNEYIPLLRLLKRVQRIAPGGSSRGQIQAIKDGRRSLRDRLALAVLRCVVIASYPVEEAAIRLAPPSRARITGWLFRREP